MQIKEYNVVFDLDDTLYKERDYVHSALRFCGQKISQLYRVRNPSKDLIIAFEAGQADPIGRFWANGGLPATAKAGLITAMQAHFPTIMLDPATKNMIKTLRGAGAGVSILTDGRSLTQRAKIAALGLLDVDVISISEEIGAEKPSLKGFEMIADLIKDRQHIYVGDNPNKDFLAPETLGWQTVMLKNDGRNIARPVVSPHAAMFCVDHLAEVPDILMK